MFCLVQIWLFWRKIGCITIRLSFCCPFNIDWETRPEALQRQTKRAILIYNWTIRSKFVFDSSPIKPGHLQNLVSKSPPPLPSISKKIQQWLLCLGLLRETLRRRIKRNNCNHCAFQIHNCFFGFTYVVLQPLPSSCNSWARCLVQPVVIWPSWQFSRCPFYEKKNLGALQNLPEWLLPILLASFFFSRFGPRLVGLLRDSGRTRRKEKEDRFK